MQTSYYKTLWGLLPGFSLLPNLEPGPSHCYRSNDIRRLESVELVVVESPSAEESSMELEHTDSLPSLESSLLMRLFVSMFM